MSTNVCVLASTSAGNCTVIWNDTVAILVDCGMNLSYTKESLAGLGLSLDHLSGVFITHSHGDHVNRYTLGRLLQHSVPIYAHTKVARSLRRKFSGLGDRTSQIVAFRDGAGQVTGFSYNAFPVPHDSVGGCYGYSFLLAHEKGDHKVTVATDLGETDPVLVRSFADSDIIVIESNHDVTLLAESRRPQWLKDRIVSIGHLSNDQCGVFIEQVLHASTRCPAAIVLAHISQECNTNAHATTRMRETLTIAKKQHVAVVETFKEKPSLVVQV